MSMDPTPFDDLHRAEVLPFAGRVGEPRIAAGYLDTAVAEDLLQTLQSHAGIEHLRGKGVAQLVDCVPLVVKPCLCQGPLEDDTCRCVVHFLAARGVENITPLFLAVVEPLSKGLAGIV